MSPTPHPVGAPVAEGARRSINPLTLMLLMTAGVVLLSAVCAHAGLSAVDPRTGRTLVARNLLSAEDLRWLLSEMPATFTGFEPLGMVLLILMGASTAEQVGLLGAGLRAMLARVPGRALTPSMALVGILAHIGSDAGYFIVIPFAGYAFAAKGRNPLAGVCAAFAAVGGGYGANLLVTPTDAAVYALTQNAVRNVVPGYSIDLLANYFLLATFALLVVAIVTALTDRWLEPCLERRGLGVHALATVEGSEPATEATPGPALRRAALAMVGVLALGAAAGLLPGGPLRGDDGGLQPFYHSFSAILFLTLLVGAIVYGVAAGAIRSQDEAYAAITRGIADAAPFILLMLIVAHFAGLITRSGLPPIIAVESAGRLREAGISGPTLVVLFSLLTAALNVILPSTSAKWALMAPTVVPMMMALGVSPEMTTAAYRLGASASELVSPAAMTPIALLFARRYAPHLGFGRFIGLMIPYSLAILVTGTALLAAWLALGLPLGPTGARPFL